jgi:hypothetical protein
MAILTEAQRAWLVQPGNPAAVRENYPWFHCRGNNLALLCPACSSYPILLTARPGWRGSREEVGSICPNKECQAKVWMLSPVAAGEPVLDVVVTYRPGLTAPTHS